MGFPKTTGAATGVTIALESAQKLQPMFVRSYLIQTGRGRHDWKVASVGEVERSFPQHREHRRVRPVLLHRHTYLLDVRWRRAILSAR
jgi:hypothetical protein